MFALIVIGVGIIDEEVGKRCWSSRDSGMKAARVPTKVSLDRDAENIDDAMDEQQK